MSALVVDTSSWVAYFGGARGDVLERALEEGRVYLPVVVAAELLSGKMSLRQRSALESLLADLPALGTDASHWFRVGALRRAVASKGVAMSTPDAHVAQCALDLDAELLTEDGVFRRVARHVRLRIAR